MLQIGDTLQTDERTYTVLQMLGKGANTAAYLAECQHSGLSAKCILKEYAPQNPDDSARGKARFLDSGRTQNAIRQMSVLNNQTPPVSHIFEANGTAYIDVACFGGTTLDRLKGLSLPHSMEICQTIAKTVGYYHNAGFLCLDLKPENIFVLQNAPDDTLTQIVEFIDFDSIRSIAELNDSTSFSYTKEWAAPEQMNPYSTSPIGMTADIYSLGEIVFYLLFERHSTEQEHRGFSKYPFNEVKREYRKYTDRPDVQALFTRLFRSTIRSAASNRFQNMADAEKLLKLLCEELNKKDYVIPKLPAVSPHFVGRDTEVKAIAECLQDNRVLYLTGIGGIGKSTLIRNYIIRSQPDYDVIVYLEFDGDFRRTFCDDMQLQISTISRSGSESADDYFLRKLAYLRNICVEKRVLFVLDNFSGTVTKEMSRVIDCGYDTVIVTRSQPPKNSFAFLEVGAITNDAELFRLIALNLERPVTKDERLCFAEIIALVQGHTLVIELIARQMAAGRLSIRTALELIQKHGFSHFSDAKIGNYKDGEEVYDTLSGIITALFAASGLSGESRLTLQVLSLLNVRGLESDLIRDIVKPNLSNLPQLSAEGWIYSGNIIRVHPVIAETVRNWAWTADDISVMTYHQKMIDIYVGMANAEQIRLIVRDAERYSEQHPRHIIRAMYYDMLGCCHDTLTAGNYVPQNAEEAAQFLRRVEIAEYAIQEAELSEIPEHAHYLAKYCLSLASILIRSMYQEYTDYASDLLLKAHDLIEQSEPENCENRCYFCMVTAWYFTLAEHDREQTEVYTKQAAEIACRVFPTALELIDIIYIPTANMLFYHDDMQAAAGKLEEAVEICQKNPCLLPYIDKQAELLNCLLDVYAAQYDWAKCRMLIAEIDRINEAYREQGVFREVSPEIREKADA
ncbi:MAG: protein kinase [Oscillospiraceae bacterium]|nr:protein kinase [Oscillospiraceae bacterium]